MTNLDINPDLHARMVRKIKKLATSSGKGRRLFLSFMCGIGILLWKGMH